MDLEQAIAAVQGAIWKQARQWKGHEDDMAQEITLKLITAYREQWDESKSSWTTYVGNRIRFIAVDCAREMKLIKRQTLKAWASFQSLDALMSLRFDGDGTDFFTPEDPHDDLTTVDFLDVERHMLSHPEFEIALAYCQIGNMKEVGRVFGLSESRVSQTVSKIASDPLLKARIEALCDISDLRECG